MTVQTLLSKRPEHSFLQLRGNSSRSDFNPVKSAREFSGLQCCLLMMRSTERKAVIYYFERAGIFYHWYMQEKVKKSCFTDPDGI